MTQTLSQKYTGTSYQIPNSPIKADVSQTELQIILTIRDMSIKSSPFAFLADVDANVIHRAWVPKDDASELIYQVPESSIAIEVFQTGAMACLIVRDLSGFDHEPINIFHQPDLIHRCWMAKTGV